MGCIKPKTPNNQTFTIPDFTTFFQTNKNNLSRDRNSDATTSPVNKQKKLDSFSSSFSSLQVKNPKTLLLTLFNNTYKYTEDIVNQSEDTIAIFDNTLQSNQGQVIKNDHVFSFGCKKDSSDQIDYDFILDNYMSSHQFDITFHEETNKFYASDTCKGSGLYTKVENVFTIPKLAFFSYCSTYIKIMINEESEYNTVKKNALVVKFINGEYKDKAVSFDPEKDKIIRLGRLKTNEIVSRNESVSKIQWTIMRKKNHWTIQDGGIEGNQLKPSTNGLWYMIMNKMEVTDGSLWKTGEKYLVAKIVSN